MLHLSISRASGSAHITTKTERPAAPPVGGGTRLKTLGKRRADAGGIDTMSPLTQLRASQRLILTGICTLIVFGVADTAEFYGVVDGAIAFALLLTLTVTVIWLPAAARWTRAHAGGASQ